MLAVVGLQEGNEETLTANKAGQEALAEALGVLRARPLPKETSLTGEEVVLLLHGHHLPSLSKTP